MKAASQLQRSQSLLPGQSTLPSSTIISDDLLVMECALSGLFGILTRDTLFRCTAWEDNESCITVAKSPKFNPRTKHISIKYHHFRRFLLVMELSSSNPLIWLSKLDISSPSPWERRVSVSCGISLWVGGSIGVPIGSNVNATQKKYLFFFCLLSLQFQGECENILNEFQI